MCIRLAHIWYEGWWDFPTWHITIIYIVCTRVLNRQILSMLLLKINLSPMTWIKFHNAHHQIMSDPHESEKDDAYYVPFPTINGNVASINGTIALLNQNIDVLALNSRFVLDAEWWINRNYLQLHDIARAIYHQHKHQERIDIFSYLHSIIGLFHLKSCSLNVIMHVFNGVDGDYKSVRWFVTPLYWRMVRQEVNACMYTTSCVIMFWMHIFWHALYNRYRLRLGQSCIGGCVRTSGQILSSRYQGNVVIYVGFRHSILW